MSVRAADFIMGYLAGKGVDTAFLVTGGMAMHLNDALALEPRLRTICCHNEQACSLAAEGYGHHSGRPALLSVTAGPGSVNALPGIYGAFVDSIPMIALAGQSKREVIRPTYNLTNVLRQIGEQEVDSVALAASITKYAQRITDPAHLRYELEKAFHLATTGRPGPVWLEIPLDIQAASIDPDNLAAFKIPSSAFINFSQTAAAISKSLSTAKRPLIVVGPGVRLSGDEAVLDLMAAAKSIGCPMVAAGPQDSLSTEHPAYAGEMGNLGTRAGNLAVQNADLLLFVGMRCYLHLVTYNWAMLGRHAHKIMVEEDPAEFLRPSQIADEIVAAPTAPFLAALAKACQGLDPSPIAGWLSDCRRRLALFPAVPQRLKTVLPNGRVNPYFLISELCSRLGPGDTLVTGNGSAGLIPIQAGARPEGLRLFTNQGSGSMGFGLPAGLGAATAAPDRRIVVLDGDGSLMMNLQELQTLVHHKFRVILIILDNDGYASIRQTQKNNFGHMIGTDPSSGLSCPDFLKVAEAFGLKAMEVSGPDFAEKLELGLKAPTPFVMVARIDPDQPFEPKVAARRLPDGTMVSSPMEDMSPHLSREELAENLEYDLP
jgi:acetolactate synthase-1/2/3 large subunit